MWVAKEPWFYVSFNKTMVLCKLHKNHSFTMPNKIMDLNILTEPWFYAGEIEPWVYPALQNNDSTC